MLVEWTSQFNLLRILNKTFYNYKQFWFEFHSVSTKIKQGLLIFMKQNHSVQRGALSFFGIKLLFQIHVCQITIFMQTVKIALTDSTAMNAMHVSLRDYRL